MRTLAVLTLLVSTLAACDEEPPPAPTPPPADPAAETPEPAVESPPPAPTPPPVSEGEACVRVIVVTWRTAAHAPETVTRTEQEARAKAEEIWHRLEQGEDFGTVARAESDAQRSGPRAGLLGTFERDSWPELHAAIRDPVLALAVGQTSEVLTADYGYVIANRCPVEKVHTRHILLRYQGAHNDGDTERTRDEARRLAERVHRAATAPGADFATLAREMSGDGSAERGGDIGWVGRGMLEPEYEDAAFALQPGQVSDIVETRVGFHIIQRVE